MNLFDNSKAPHSTPEDIVRGDYVAWRDSQRVNDYPVASYSLRYNFRLAGEPAREFVVNSSVDNSEYLFEIDSATSAAIDVGVYYWDLQVIRLSDSERVTVAHGSTEVLASRETDSADPRDFPRKMIALIEAAMLERATNRQLDTLAYSLGVETSATRDPAKLEKFRRDMEALKNKRIDEYNLKHGKPTRNVIKARF